MGIRRRRKKLTTIISSVDRRLRSVEYRHVPTKIAPRSITAAEITDGTIPPSDPKDSGATGATASSSAPVEFAVITAATYSSRNVTGTVDRVDITTSTDHGLSKDDKVTIYGLNNSDVNLNGTYVVTEAPSSTTLRFSRGLTGFYPAAINMLASVAVSSRFCSTTTATLTLNTTTHGFNVGDVITVSGIPDDTFFNGTFKVSGVNGANISYNFADAQASVSITASTGSVKAVLHKYAIIGDTWIDTSVSPNVVKIWDGLQWTSPSSLPDGVIIDDGVAPKAPTGLSATQNGYYDASSGAAKIAVKLTWSQPTENADNTPLRDLAGYKVYYRYQAGVDQTGSAGDGSTSTTTTNTDGTLTGTFTYSANDRMSPSNLTLSTDAGTIQPSTFFIPSGGSGTLSWTISGLAQDQDVTMSWSTPSSGSGSISGTAGTTVSTGKTNTAPSDWRYDIFGDTAITSSSQPTASDPISGGPVTASIDWQDAGETDQLGQSINGLNTDSTIIFAVKAYDSSKKNYSEMSDELTVVTGKPALILQPPSKPSVESRLGTVTVTWDGLDKDGNTPPPSFNYVEVHVGNVATFTPGVSTLKGTISNSSSGGGTYVLSDLEYGTSYYVRLVAISSTDIATTPSVASDLITVKPLVDTDLIANTLTKWPFAGNVVSAGSLADGSISASSLFGPNVITQNAISANAIGANQIAAGSIIAGKIGANAITASEIAANTISAGMIKANAIEADKIAVGAVDATKITATAIDGKTITGATIRTGASGARVQMDSTGFYAYNSSGSVTFSISASTGAVVAASYATSSDLSNGLSGKISNGGAATDINNNTVQISGGKIVAGSIDVGKLSAGELVGFTIKTASSGDRIQMTTSTMTFYGSSGSVNATVQAGAYGYLMTTGTFTMYAGNSVFFVEVSTNNDIHYSLTGGFEFTTTGNYAVSLLGGKGLYTNGTSWFDAGIKYVGRPGSTTAGSPIHVRTTGSGIDLLFEYVSSREYKSDIKDLDLENFDYDKFMNIPIKSFAYNEDYKLHGENAMRIYGYIAEDIDDAGFHDLVVYRDLPDGSRKAHSLAFHSINAITQAIVNKQAEKIQMLEARLNVLESR